VPPDKGLHPLLFWRFVAVEASPEYRWRWIAYSVLGGEVAFQSERDYDTLSECIENAKENGYVEPDAA